MNAIPIDWVERIFHRLTVRYGRDFVNRYEGVPLQDVKTDWAMVLGGFAEWGSAIGYGLDNLPAARPPTAEEFREICRKAPKPAVPAIESPKPDRERVRQVTRDAKSATSVNGTDDGRNWARRPVSVLAFQGVLELEAKGEQAFIQIANELRAAGHLDGNRVIRLFNSVTKQWVPA